MSEEGRFVSGVQGLMFTRCGLGRRCGGVKVRDQLQMMYSFSEIADSSRQLFTLQFSSYKDLG